MNEKFEFTVVGSGPSGWAAILACLDNGIKPTLIDSDNILNSTIHKIAKDYEDIRLSRITYGKKDFSLQVPYVQSYDAAENLMSWVIKKIMKPRRSLGIKIFANPMIQLGDIVSVDYVENGIDKVGATNSRFVIYNIEYSKTHDGPEMKIFLSEVV